jgi:hypothetical protein
MHRALLIPLFIDIIAELFDVLRYFKCVRRLMTASLDLDVAGRQFPAYADIPARAMRWRWSRWDGRSLKGCLSGRRKVSTISRTASNCFRPLSASCRARAAGSLMISASTARL